MGRTLSRPLRVSGRPISNLPQFLNKGALKAYRISRSRKLLVAATRSAPHLTRETFSGRRPADGADTLGGVFRPGENLALGRRGSVLRRLYLRPQSQLTTIFPGTKDSYTHPTTPSAGRTGGVLTCLTKSPFHPRFHLTPLL